MTATQTDPNTTDLDKKKVEAAFVLMARAGVRVPSLIADILRYSGISRSDIAIDAKCTERYVKSCVQGNARPHKAVRSATSSRLGFDPWKVLEMDRDNSWRAASSVAEELNK